MNYVYDISLNLNKDYIDFYDWNENDDIIYFIKIPIIKISNNMMKDILNNSIKVDERFISSIKDKSKNYLKKNIKYICIFASEDLLIGIQFNEDREISKRSSISIDEVLDLLDYSKNLKELSINYKIISKLEEDNFYTRNEKNIMTTVDKFLSYIYKNKKNDILRYLYYELYNENNKDDYFMYYRLKRIIKTSNIKLNKLDYIINKISINKTYI